MTQILAGGSLGIKEATLWFGVGVFCLVLAVGAHAGEYFVAVDGADTNGGTQDRPFRTIQKAADMMKPGDTCYVRGGVYREVLRPRRSGKAGKPICFRAWPGEVVVLCGTEPIQGKWSLHKDRIYKIQVPYTFDQLFLDKQMMIEARWPNMRFDQRFDKGVWAVAGKGSTYGTMVDPALAETDIDWTGATTTLNVGSWQTWRRIVRDHKAGSDRFGYDRDLSSRLESKRRWEGFDRYFISGKPEALDSPTEWHLDRNNSTLYLWAPGGQNPAKHNVEAKVHNYVFDARGLAYVELHGFHFFGAKFKFERCEHCVVDGCHLRFGTCGQGLEAAPPTLIDGSNNIMRNCSVAYSDGPAVMMQGQNNTLENCLIHDIDWHALGYGRGVSMGGSATSVIRRCTIFNIGSSEGLVVPGRGPSIVEYNYIHHVGLVQSDGALIQSHGIRLAGTIIRYNWVHDHNAFNWGGNGIRGDDLTRNLLVHHNVAWNCREKGIIVKGDHNCVYNNTCLHNPKIDILTPSRAEPFKAWAPRQHPHLLGKQNANTHIANNCAAVITGTFSWQKTASAPLGRTENNYSGKQPMLIDPAGLDFRPRAGSALIDAGTHIPGFTDGYKGDTPDIGAYEFGAQRWLPGCSNALWISAPQKRADGTSAMRVALRMPPTEPVSLMVTSSDPGMTLNAGEMLTFTEANWMHTQTITLSACGKTLALHFCDDHLGSSRISDVGAIDSRLGQVVEFDRPMLATKPAEFAHYAE